MKYGALVVGLFFLGGCLVRTYTVTKPRVDTTIEGNQGYLFGAPREESKPKFGNQRKITIFEVEFGSHPPRSLRRKKVNEEREIVEFDETGREEQIREEVIYPDEVISEEDNERFYTIQKNETLQKISKKFYGTTKKWKFLYNHNKDILKSPNKIYPGKRIRIPVLD